MGEGTWQVLPSATGRGGRLLSTRGGGCDAATAALPAAVASRARGGRVERVAYSMHASLVSRSRRGRAWVVRARGKCCQARPIEVAGCSARVVVGVVRLQPPCLVPPCRRDVTDGARRSCAEPQKTGATSTGGSHAMVIHRTHPYPAYGGPGPVGGGPRGRRDAFGNPGPIG